jgi:hypothetical protein
MCRFTARIRVRTPYHHRIFAPKKQCITKQYEKKRNKISVLTEFSTIKIGLYIHLPTNGMNRIKNINNNNKPNESISVILYQLFYRRWLLLLRECYPCNATGSVILSNIYRAHCIAQRTIICIVQIQ